MNNFDQEYNLNISELIDLMSILQIKEVKSKNLNKKTKSQLGSLRKDLKGRKRSPPNLALKQKNILIEQKRGIKQKIISRLWVILKKLIS